MELPKYPHCAIICGQTGCGKTEFVLDLLEKEGFDKNIILNAKKIIQNLALNPINTNF